MRETNQSQLIKYLPGYYRSEGAENGADLVEKFLVIWETILVKKSSGGTARQSLGQKLEHAWGYFDPQDAPEEFIEWVAECIGLTLKSDWDALKKREIIAKIIPLYRKRGTKSGLQRYLQVYVGEEVSINIHENPGIEVGKAEVGIDTVVGGAYFFVVEIDLRDVHVPPEKTKFDNQLKSISEVIEREKPIHTIYGVRIVGIGKICIGSRSTVGIDTLMG